MRLYQQILQPGGYINLKTDSPSLYRFTKWVIDLHELPLVQDMDDVYTQETLSESLRIKTHYEGLDIAQSNRIHYLQFGLPGTPLPDKNEALKELLLEEGTDRRS